jgi:flagellar motor protein MotB
MTSIRLKAFAAAALALAAAPALAQAPASPPPLATPNPNYVTIIMEQDVARPAAEVWKKIGKYCDIAAWSPGLRCQLAGKDGEVGAVRTLNGTTLEILVARTDLSYTYAQPVRVGQVYNLYHGTLEAKPVTATASKLFYTLILDNAMLADDAARKADVERRRARFTQALKDMKTLAEGGTLPPPPAPPDGEQLMRLRQFLAPEIAQNLVVVISDPSTVRVRTTVGQLFKSGSDQLDSGRVALFERIGKAVDTEPGPVRVEGYSDSDRLSSVSFPDNTALSKARADTVATLIRKALADPTRVTTEGYGEAQPLAPNTTAAGKAQNRRVEIVIQRKG